MTIFIFCSLAVNYVFSSFLMNYWIDFVLMKNNCKKQKIKCSFASLSNKNTDISICKHINRNGCATNAKFFSTNAKSLSVFGCWRPQNCSLKRIPTLFDAACNFFEQSINSFFFELSNIFFCINVCNK